MTGLIRTKIKEEGNGVEKGKKEERFAVVKDIYFVEGEKAQSNINRED